jgi:predicted DNA-binding transcriptional regulator YafY
MAGYSGGIDHLQEEDIINLYISSIGIIPDKHSDMASKLNNTLIKLQSNFSQNQISEFNRIKKRFHFDDTTWWGENHTINDIDIVIYAVLQSKGLEITYTKNNGTTSIRRVHPYGIVVKRMDWYLVGYCVKNKKIQSFKCDRILDSRLLNEYFEVPADFTIEEYWNDAKYTFKNSCIQREIYPVVIKLDKSKAASLENLEILETKIEEDYIAVTINMYGYQYAIEDIMKLIRYAEILKPIELRSFVECELNRILLMYKDLH